MKLLIIGGGRMGMRHANGALDVAVLNEICIADISVQSLENAKTELATHPNAGKLQFRHVSELDNYNFDIVIIATTAYDRLNICKMALACNPKYVLVEKPIAQSYDDVLKVIDLFKSSNTVVGVNFVYRLYPYFKALKEDINKWPQFIGSKNIMFNGGAIGIGANGIHQIDMLFHLFDAHRAELSAGEIETTLIPSGRGTQFNEFGGWANINFFDKNDNRLGRGVISLSSTCSAFGGWDIIGSHGRIRMNEFEGERINVLRKEDSTMPVNRYQADYLPAQNVKIEIPKIPALTKDWIENIIAGSNILPSLPEALRAHKIMFDWLSLSKTHKDLFPIT